MAQEGAAVKKSSVRDMTEGSIVKQIIMFSLPLMAGNIFQMLYNTVDSVVVGNFVGTEALAAVGSTTMIVNILVFFFNGFSIGASVVISKFFGAHNDKMLHRAIETTIAATFLLSVIFTISGVATVPFMLRLMDTPSDVFEPAATYLRIYIGGISGLFIYNMGSGVLRAVGDTVHPLYFLILTSVLNIVLDLAFVLIVPWGIAGVAIATIISQFVSAFAVLILLSRTHEIYKLTWHDLKIDGEILGSIVAVGLPAAFQSVITSFSNVFVQGYINYFGSSAMAGWSCYNKLDSFIMLPMQSMSMAATTFVSQNIGAGKVDRANRSVGITLALSVAITLGIVAVLDIFAPQTVGLFTSDSEVIEYGVMFVRANCFFLAFNCANHVLAASLRGRGDSTGPMVIMLVAFVAIRQVYLYVLTHYIANTPLLVGIGYPVGWVCCCIIESVYYVIKQKRAVRA